MAELAQKGRGVRRWPWRAIGWALALSVVIDSTLLVVERWKPLPQEPGPNLTNWNTPPLTSTEQLGMEVLVLAFINIAFVLTVLGASFVISRIRKRRAGVVTALFSLLLLPVAFVGVIGTIGSCLWIARRLLGER